MKFNLSLLLIVIFSLFLECYASAQTTAKSFVHDGSTRNYRYYVPSNYTGNKPVPLVLVLHGMGDNGSSMQNWSGFDDVADTAGFIAVYPNALTSPGGTAWNCGLPYNNTVDDVGFISRMLDSIITYVNIDTTRIFSTGFSRGAFMSSWLACNMTNRIRAIAPVAGTISTTLTSNCNINKKIPVFQMHGTADGTVSYNGNSPLSIESVSNFLTLWRNNNECTDTTEYALPNNVTDGYSIDATKNQCDSSEVLHYKVSNLGHTWLFKPGNDVSYTEEIWKFFMKYKTQLVSNTLDFSEDENINIYPNPSTQILQISNSKKILSAQLLSISGQVLQEKKNITSSNEMIIPTEEFSEGIYLLRLIGEDFTTDKKVVISK